MNESQQLDRTKRLFHRKMRQIYYITTTNKKEKEGTAVLFSSRIKDEERENNRKRREMRGARWPKGNDVPNSI